MLDKFSEELRAKIRSTPNLRPFVCNGNPLDCKIFIVGFNPATEMKREFLEDWNDRKGFDKSLWLEHYVSERASTPVKQGKKRKNKFSNTRLRIDWLTDTLAPIKCLETNLYSKATRTAKELLPIDRDIQIFKFLFDSIKPKLLFLHGTDVRLEIEKIFSIKLSENDFSKYNIFGNDVIIISKMHLSRGWSKINTINFANSLKSHFLTP